MIAQQLKRRIDLFCSSILSLEGEEIIGSRGQDYQELERELRLAQRTNKRLIKGNIRLKKRLRRAKVNIRQLKLLLSESIHALKKNSQKILTSQPSQPQKTLKQKTPIQKRVEKPAKLPSQKPKETPKKDQSTNKNPTQAITEPIHPPNKVCNKSIQVGLATIPTITATSVRHNNYLYSEFNANQIIDRKLAAKVGHLYDAYLRQSEKTIDSLCFRLIDVKKHKQAGIIGDSWTFIALKDTSTYMLATRGKGLKVIRNNAKLYCYKLPAGAQLLLDMIYVRYLDCFFMQCGTKLYRKAIDNRHPEPYMDLVTGERVAGSLRCSDLNRRLIVNKEGKNIAVVNLETKEIEIDIEKKKGNKIADFQLFGEFEDRVAAITKNGYLLLYKIDFEKKVGFVASQSKIRLMKDGWREEGCTLEVCDKNRHVCVAIEEMDRFRSSRVIIFAIKENHFVRKAIIDQQPQKLGYQLVIRCYGYVGNHLLWIGFSLNHNGISFVVYDYNVLSEELSELKMKRTLSQEKVAVTVQRIDNSFYYVGMSGRVIRLKIEV